MKFSVFLPTILLIFLLGCSNEIEKLPAPKALHISLSSRDIGTTVDFFRHLGFSKLDGRTTGKNPWALLSGGGVQLMLSQSPFPSPALTYYATDMDQQVERFRQKGIRFSNVVNREGQVSSAIVTTPEGTGLTFIKIDPTVFPAADGNSELLAGKFAGLLISTANPAVSRQFWMDLGFSPVGDSTEQKLSDGLISIELSGDSLNRSPRLLFKNNRMGEMIRHLQKSNISYQTLAKTAAGEAVRLQMQTPDGLTIEIYSPHK